MKQITKLITVICSGLASFFVVGCSGTPKHVYGPAPVNENAGQEAVQVENNGSSSNDDSAVKAEDVPQVDEPAAPIYGMPMPPDAGSPVYDPENDKAADGDSAEDMEQLKDANKPERPIVTKYGIQPTINRYPD